MVFNSVNINNYYTVILQINELYELAKKAENLSQVLPQVLDRLLALQTLHQQGLKHYITSFI